MTAKPDWYPDPNDSQIQRWWSGEEWTEHTAPLPPRDKNKASSGLIAAGWICALFFPAIGLVIGALIWSNGDDEGVAIAGVSLILTVLLVIVIL